MDGNGTGAPPTAVILAGGKGTRLAPMTRVLPKPLMPLVDGPIIDVLLRQLRLQGWDGATLSVGHMADLIRAYCGSGSRWDMRLEYVEEAEPLGTVGPLALLPEAAVGDALLVMNGDLLTTLRFAELVAAHRRSEALATIAVYRRDVQMEFGVLELLPDDEGGLPRVTSYTEKPEIPATVSMGVYVFRPEVLEYIDKGVRLDLPELVHRLMADGRTVTAYPFDGYWLDIGRHSDYQAAIDDFETIRHELFTGAGIGG